MRKFGLIFLSILILLAVCIPTREVGAQTNQVLGPIYVVQEGDALWDIAYRFHVSLSDLEIANGITDPNQITIDQHLVIPGLEGIQGILTTENIQYGETLYSLSLRYRIPVDMLGRLNHLTSPNELYAGYSLVVLKENIPASLGKRATIGAAESLLELAILNGSDPWTLMKENQLNNSSQLLPGDIIRLQGQDDGGPGGLPPGITAVDITGLKQGQTAVLTMTGEAGAAITGTLMDHSLTFFTDSGSYVALQGVHAMQQPGLYPLDLSVSLPNESLFAYSQNVFVAPGDFLYDAPISVDPATLDPENTIPEDKQWFSLASQDSSEKLWQGAFSVPVDPEYAGCYASQYGSRRSYNGSDYIYFHTGLDYCGQIGDSIYAAAAGKVVFTGLMTVRGNATMIDHGHGVFSAYMHQSEILVKLGDHVEQGQLIGLVGNTGRVDGPHLHFEVLVGGVQVNPQEWLSEDIP